MGAAADAVAAQERTDACRSCRRRLRCAAPCKDNRHTQGTRNTARTQKTQRDARAGGSDARAGPAGVYDAAVTLGAGKAATPISKLIPLSFLSGAHIALGAMLAVSVGGSVPEEE